MGLDWSALAKIDWWRLVWMNLAIAALVGGTVFLFAHFVLGSPTPNAEQDVGGAGPLPFRRAKPLSLSEVAGSRKGKKKGKNKPAQEEEQGGSQSKGLSAEEEALLRKEEEDLVKQIEAAKEMLRLDDEKKELVQKLRRRAPRPESSGAE